MYQTRQTSQRAEEFQICQHYLVVQLGSVQNTSAYEEEISTNNEEFND
jgi:hypothetical protein